MPALLRGGLPCPQPPCVRTVAGPCAVRRARRARVGAGRASGCRRRAGRPRPGVGLSCPERLGDAAGDGLRRTDAGRYRPAALLRTDRPVGRARDLLQRSGRDRRRGPRPRPARRRDDDHRRTVLDGPQTEPLHRGRRGPPHPRPDHARGGGLLVVPGFRPFVLRAGHRAAGSLDLHRLRLRESAQGTADARRHVLPPEHGARVRLPDRQARPDPPQAQRVLQIGQHQRARGLRASADVLPRVLDQPELLAEFAGRRLRRRAAAVRRQRELALDAARALQQPREVLCVVRAASRLRQRLGRRLDQPDDAAAETVQHQRVRQVLVGVSGPNVSAGERVPAGLRLPALRVGVRQRQRDGRARRIVRRRDDELLLHEPVAATQARHRRRAVLRRPLAPVGTGPSGERPVLVERFRPQDQQAAAELPSAFRDRFRSRPVRRRSVSGRRLLHVALLQLPRRHALHAGAADRPQRIVLQRLVRRPAHGLFAPPPHRHQSDDRVAE